MTHTVQAHSESPGCRGGTAPDAAEAVSIRIAGVVLVLFVTDADHNYPVRTLWGEVTVAVSGITSICVLRCDAGGTPRLGGSVGAVSATSLHVTAEMPYS